MGTISLSLPSDGQTIDAADVNTPFNTISAAINGNLDDDNIKVGANINGTKLLANSIPPTAFDVNARAGWEASILAAPNTITALGNRSYSIVFNTVDYTGALSAGMRLRTTRTVAAPTQSTSLNGTTQYYSKSSPSGMTFTDDFVASAWIKLNAYNTTSAQRIVSRYNGTSGWELRIGTAGQVEMVGYNASSANFSFVQSYQSVPLNKWVHVTAQLDMSTFTATTTTSYTMIDGIDVPATVSRAGTNPTALVQAGNLEIGAGNSGTLPFNGRISQVAVYSAKVTQATVLASMHQTLTGSETSLVSAYSFNNVITDLNANANNLTANGGAVATNADSPYGGQSNGLIDANLDYGIITKTAFSTNTTLTVQVPEGCTIPTSGGISAVSYSTQKTPYLFPVNKTKWRVTQVWRIQQSVTSNATFGSFAGIQLTVPIGDWDVGYGLAFFSQTTTQVNWCLSSTSQTGLTITTSDLTLQTAISTAAATLSAQWYARTSVNVSAAATYLMYTLGATTNVGIIGSQTGNEIFADFNLL